MNEITQNYIIKSHVKNDRMAGHVLSYIPQPEEMKMPHNISEGSKEFGFLDLVDIINPMQHIPLINIAYRAITGDEISPISKIIGGAVFGGAAGAAGGIISVAIEGSNGHNVIENITSLAGIRNNKSYDYKIEANAYEDLPASLLAFSLPPVNIIQNGYDHVKIASGRTAGTITVYS